MDFFLEIYTEEIPAKMQKKASEDFAKITQEVLKREGLEIADTSINSYITPNRQSLYISTIQSSIEIPEFLKYGPQINANEKAIDGFLRSNSLKSIDQLDVAESKGKKCYLYRQPKTIIKTSDILEKNIPVILDKMVNSWPKLMRWDVAGLKKQPKWIRPIRNIAALCGEDGINFEYAGLKSNNITYGLNKEKIKISRAENYIDFLSKHNVILDQKKRKESIIKQVNDIVSKTNLELFDNPETSNLFNEITYLCEHPTALLASIDERFLKLPKEVLLLTLKNNQKYICLKNKEGNFANKFIFIANNIITKDNKEKIIKDNEKLVNARFCDVEFFIEDDLKKPLIERINDLDKIVFHTKLGTLKEKIHRLESAAKIIGVFIPGTNLIDIDKVVQLSKVDLTTKSVAELPELQGKIGAYYAKKQGQSEEISNAIAEQYLPLGPASTLPQAPLGITLSIVDKVDSIAGFYLANDKPTSSKDPYGLRRAVLGIIRISFEHNIEFPIRISVEKALNSYPVKLSKKLLSEVSEEKFQIAKKHLVEEIIIFFVERLKTYLKESKNLRSEIVNIVIDEYLSNLDKHRYCNILYLYKKIAFLSNYIDDKKNEEILNLYKRSANILVIEEKKDATKHNGKVSRLHLKNKYEKALYLGIKKMSHKFKKLVSKGNFEEAFELISSIKLPLNQFFDNVLINDEDPAIRENRLRILNKVVDHFNYVANLSKLK
ncbi:MAG: glycine--tRNA ligase subunit beta [Rickettsiales bacterium]|nr:glycine--tRNA ligase subunit beta [Rickettsiales bacterium]